MEKIVCAAIWYDDGKERSHLPINVKTGIVSAGFRHPNCFVTLTALYPDWQTDSMQDDLRVAVLRKCKQGFLTSTNRFVNRIEGASIAISSGQIQELKYPPMLYSEDIY
jgi:hypothetical protein